MLFTHFLLERLSLLEKVTRGYGDCISERALFAALSGQGLPAEEFSILLEWGLIQGLLTERDTMSGRRFVVDRQSLAQMRARANGETPGTEYHPTAQQRDIRPGPINKN